MEKGFTEQQAKILYHSHVKSNHIEPLPPQSDRSGIEITKPTQSKHEIEPRPLKEKYEHPQSSTPASKIEDAMKLIFVDPKTLVCPGTRITADLDPEKLDQLRASISREGIKQPITCNRINGELVIIDGLHRAQLAEECHLDLVPVVVVSGSIEQNLIDNFVTNHIRGKIQPSQMIKVLATLEKQYGFNLEKFSEITGYSRSWLNKLMNIVHASPYVQDNLDKGKINISQAAAIAKLPTHKVQDRTLDIVRTTWRDAKRTESFVKEVQKELSKPEPERVEIESVVIKDSCQCCGTQFPIDELEVIRIHKDHLSTFFNVIRNAQEIIKSQT